MNIGRSVVLPHWSKDKVEIECMGYVGGKTPTESQSYLFFSNLKHIDVYSFL
jgi:hypothetical protein